VILSLNCAHEHKSHEKSFFEHEANLEEEILFYMKIYIRPGWFMTFIIINEIQSRMYHNAGFSQPLAATGHTGIDYDMALQPTGLLHMAETPLLFYGHQNMSFTTGMEQQNLGLNTNEIHQPGLNKLTQAVHYDSYWRTTQKDSFLMNHRTTTIAQQLLHDESYEPRLSAPTMTETTSKGNNHVVESALKHTCGICFQRFACRKTFSQHARTHRDHILHFCNICNRGFRQRSTMITHQRVHTGEKPYLCPSCPRRFSDHSSLIKHKRVHSGEKPYSCPECRRGFTQSGNLKRHLKRVHRN